MLRQSWWKIIGVTLVLYSLVAGLLVPLKPGIYSVVPNNFKAGQPVELTITGYNTNYKGATEDMRIWLKLDSVNTLYSNSYKVVSDNTFTANFDIPTHFPSKDKIENFSLIVDNKVDGTSVNPDAVTIIQKEINAAAVTNVWKQNPIVNTNYSSGYNFPFRAILYETIRNTYYHVPLWFAMLIVFIASVVMSFKYLRTGNPHDEWKALSLTTSGTLFGMLGLVTGMIWAKHTWGTYWTWEEVKLNMTAIAMLIYLAYFILRGSVDDPEKKGRIASVYNIFAFAALIPLIFVIPRMTSSLHPGNGGNPALGSGDLDNTMRMIFYPAIIGWTLVGVWISTLIYRYKALKDRILSEF